MKVFKIVCLIILSCILLATIAVFEDKAWPAGSSIAGILLGFSLPALVHRCQDLTDTTTWKTTQRQLERGGFINDDTVIRVSFAYLYRIKICDKYLLVKNERGTEKYQPVGGVYKLKGNEKIWLRNCFHVMDDNKIFIDESSRDDYRLRLENKYLRKFINRFNGKAEREGVGDLSREFKEELVTKGIVDWSQITYRYCGRHMTELKFGDHFRIYELLLADIVELIPTQDQENELRMLAEKESDAYRFASAEEIMSLGIDTAGGNLIESIGNHTQKILQEKESQLMKIHNVGEIYTVRL